MKYLFEKEARICFYGLLQSLLGTLSMNFRSLCQHGTEILLIK